MFAVRGIIVAFIEFLIVYCTLSLAVFCAWRRVWLSLSFNGSRLRQHSARRAANLLFSLRMFPFVASLLITAAVTIPSFVLLEPRAVDEPLSALLLGLGVCAVALVIYGAANAVWAARKVGQSISVWTAAASPIEPCASVPVWRIAPRVPAMTAVGILRPRILLSGAAESALTAGELQVALSHEVAHTRRRDNLKKLLMRFVAFPGLGGLEAAWLEATELSADDDAVSSAGEALDLAAALIKLSHLALEPAEDLTASLVRGPKSLMSTRIQRLIAWAEWSRAGQSRAAAFSPWYGLAAVLTSIAAFVHAYSHLLARVHTATEWLVR
jgi:Zn-dependent protease with chaperone function